MPLGKHSGFECRSWGVLPDKKSRASRVLGKPKEQGRNEKEEEVPACSTIIKNMYLFCVYVYTLVSKGQGLYICIATINTTTRQQLVTGMPPPLTQNMKHTQPTIWWANAVFFILVHFGALVGIYYFPPWATSRATLLLSFTIWQLSNFGYVNNPNCQ